MDTSRPVSLAYFTTTTAMVRNNQGRPARLITGARKMRSTGVDQRRARVDEKSRIQALDRTPLISKIVAWRARRSKTATVIAGSGNA